MALTFGACSIILAAFAAAACGASRAADTLQVGTTVTYRDLSGRAWCATIFAIGEGAGGAPIAWLTIDVDPRRTFRVPLAELTPGCTL